MTTLNDEPPDYEEDIEPEGEITLIPWRFILVVILAILLLMAGAYVQSRAHELFTGMFDPVTHRGCCNNGDCKLVPKEMGQVVFPWIGGTYRVRLTLAQARYFNPHMTQPVDAIVDGARVIWAMPTEWAICLNPYDESAMPAYSGMRVRCLLGFSGS